MCGSKPSTPAPQPAPAPPEPEPPPREPTARDSELDTNRDAQQRAAAQQRSGLASTLVSDQSSLGATPSVRPTLG